jgi:hypothetical protein
MSEIKTGGPAFPVADPFAVKSPPTDAEALRLQQGMTLRDYFAAKAMQELMQMEHVETYASAATRAYEMADAMLKAREQ